MGILFYFESFSYKTGGVMRSGSQNFGLVKTDEMHGVERVFGYGEFEHSLIQKQTSQ